MLGVDPRTWEPIRSSRGCTPYKLPKFTPYYSYLSSGTYQNLMTFITSTFYKTIRYSDRVQSFYTEQMKNGEINVPGPLQSYPFNYTFDLLVNRGNPRTYIPPYILECHNDYMWRAVLKAAKILFR